MTDWEKHYATGAGYRYWPNEELVRFVGARQFDMVVEVGCGNGANLWFLAEHASRVYGCDPCAIARTAALQLCAQRGARNVLIRADDARTLTGIADGGADLVVDCMVSQHLPWAGYAAHDESPKAQAFAEYSRVLSPGGRLFLYHLSHESRGLADLFPDVKIWPATEQQLRWALEDHSFRDFVNYSVRRTYPGGRGMAVYDIITAEAK